MRLFAASRRSSSRRRALLLCPLLLTGLLVLINTCDARNLRSARLSTAAAASLGMPSSPTSPSSAAAGAKGSTNNKPAPTLLFTLQSDSAFLQLGEPGDPDPDLGKLTLEGVAPTAVWFSERPDRRAGALPTATLASEALDIIVDDDDGDDELAAAGDGASSSSSSSPSSSSSSSSPPPRRQATWLGVPNVALTGTSEGGGAATAVLTVLGRPSYDEKTRTMIADVHVVPMKSLTSEKEEVHLHLATATTTAVVLPPPPHSPPGSAPKQPRSLSLTRAALLIDQMPISDGYIGNQYGFANDCLSTMSPSCNPFSGTGFYRPGFVGMLGGQMGPGNTPQYPPGTRGQERYPNPQQPPTARSPPSSLPPPPPPVVGSGSSGTNGGGQAYLMSQPYDPSKGR